MMSSILQITSMSTYMEDEEEVGQLLDVLIPYDRDQLLLPLLEGEMEIEEAVKTGQPEKVILYHAMDTLVYLYSRIRQIVVEGKVSPDRLNVRAFKDHWPLLQSEDALPGPLKTSFLKEAKSAKEFVRMLEDEGYCLGSEKPKGYCDPEVSASLIDRHEGVRERMMAFNINLFGGMKKSFYKDNAWDLFRTYSGPLALTGAFNHISARADVMTLLGLTGDDEDTKTKRQRFEHQMGCVSYVYSALSNNPYYVLEMPFTPDRREKLGRKALGLKFMEGLFSEETKEAVVKAFDYNMERQEEKSGAPQCYRTINGVRKMHSDGKCATGVIVQINRASGWLLSEEPIRDAIFKMVDEAATDLRKNANIVPDPPPPPSKEPEKPAADGTAKSEEGTEGETPPPPEEVDGGRAPNPSGANGGDSHTEGDSDSHGLKPISIKGETDAAGGNEGAGTASSPSGKSEAETGADKGGQPSKSNWGPGVVFMTVLFVVLGLTAAGGIGYAVYKYNTGT
uniref:Uncharacterized protein n=1 Tax=Chromera velia CCMP2878 TaxID=1169474 RepID=A0A0G4IBA2_9ALVE|eukprot:Cvel_2152.t1-p1 / transcript=Cvel_2152.t1 / gene=Cvel_2152 / organism=Chromera_velia_CCMP2878 / gene_product=hypothetical protein / transcript_product=hypothetical protein / location=Cvel_scaffold83:112796-117403(-) / protein_length=507 / sequence_SO=supercontig / SO=protein_coding / is_pseudo=false